MKMGSENKHYNVPERRIKDRRHTEDRRVSARFHDILGRRSGVERRLPIAS